LCEIKSIKT